MSVADRASRSAEVVSPAVTPPDHVMVARQPILDRDRRVFGYELLFRPTDESDVLEATDDAKTARVMTDAMLAFGLDRLTNGHAAFVNVTRELLIHDLVRTLPSDRVVLELPRDVEVDGALIEACTKLRAGGYRLALDNFSPRGSATPLLPHVDFVKVDFWATTFRDVQAAVDGAGLARQPSLIAEKVEAQEVFDEAVGEGFTHFQGYFFERPTSYQTQAVPGSQAVYLRLLKALGDPDLSVQVIADLVQQDAALCYRVLRTVNSAAFAQQREVTSIRQALVLLGRDTIRRWISLWVLADLGAQVPEELVTMACVRARTCELLASAMISDEIGPQAFLLGMCSLLDSILGRSMEAVLEDLPLPRDMQAALLGYENTHRHLLDCAIAYERGDWTRCMPLVALLELQPSWLPRAYGDALTWAHQLREQTREATS